MSNSNIGKLIRHICLGFLIIFFSPLVSFASHNIEKRGNTGKPGVHVIGQLLVPDPSGRHWDVVRGLNQVWESKPRATKDQLTTHIAKHIFSDGNLSKAKVLASTRSALSDLANHLGMNVTQLIDVNTHSREELVRTGKMLEEEYFCFDHFDNDIYRDLVKLVGNAIALTNTPKKHANYVDRMVWILSKEMRRVTKQGPIPSDAEISDQINVVHQRIRVLRAGLYSNLRRAGRYGVGENAILQTGPKSLLTAIFKKADHFDVSVDEFEALLRTVDLAEN